MKVKKLFLMVLVVLVAMSLIAASYPAAKSYKVVAGKSPTIALGKQGVAYTKSQLSGTLTLKLKDKDPLGGTGDGLKTSHKLLDARFVDSNGQKVTKVIGPVYVYFDIDKTEAKALKSGKLAVFYFDPWFGDWRECTTYQVTGPNGVRAACRMRNYGLFGLGSK